jgi:hypothetical protein
MESTTTNKTIVLCVPGSSFSREWVQCLSTAIADLSRDGHTIQLSFAYDANVFYARARTLLCQTTRGVDQKPFDGKLEYDYIMWVDSDVLFSADHVRALMRHEDLDVVCGAYLMADNTRYPLVETMDDADFLRDGHYKFLNREDLAAKGETPFPVAYAGMGFILMKAGVLEKLKYPYFAPRILDFGTDGRIVELASEDVSLCINLKEAGISIMVDPTVRVPHLKLVPLI